MPKKRSGDIGEKQLSSKPKKAGRPISEQKDSSILGPEAVVPIVGIGASAGGLDAFEKFFTNMPSDTGMPLSWFSIWTLPTRAF